MEIDGLAEVKARVARLVSRLVDLDNDLPQMVFKGGGWRFRFFERPVLLNKELMENVIENSFATFGPGLFVKFSRLPDCNSVVAIDSTDVERAFDSVAEAYDGNLMGLGYPIVFGDLDGRWIGFESVREELGVLAVRDSEEGREFFTSLDEELISVGDLQAWSREGDGWGKIAETFLVAYGV
ncbi:hypothetical protein JY452_12020 [Stenotrophomonas maltophilia]|nr:hypothetical protein [Stenotrophomonas maltophilia]